MQEAFRPNPVASSGRLAFGEAAEASRPDCLRTLVRAERSAVAREAVRSSDVNLGEPLLLRRQPVALHAPKEEVLLAGFVAQTREQKALDHAAKEFPVHVAALAPAE